MNNSTKIIVTLLLIIILIPFSYFTYILSEEEYKSPTNVDKYVTIESVQYIPNGRSTALCQMVCKDNKGIEYHVTDSDSHFVGDIYQYSEHHGRFYIYGCVSAGLILSILFVLCFVVCIYGIIKLIGDKF